MNGSKCIACGDTVPEGCQVCPSCEKLSPKELIVRIENREAKKDRTALIQWKWGIDTYAKYKVISAIIILLIWIGIILAILRG